MLKILKRFLSHVVVLRKASGYVICVGVSIEIIRPYFVSLKVLQFI